MSESLDILFSPLRMGRLHLANRFVMAPMTRSRANADDTVSELHVEYYAQRASAGMIVTEGVHPSIHGKGYCRTPGIYNAAQVRAWRAVTDAVHARGGTIVCQLMHCGRVGSRLNKAADAETVAPSAIACGAKIFTEQGMQQMETPRALQTAEVAGVVEEYRRATALAFEAGFDGVELHCTSGYLPAQFLSTGTNHREDRYGASLQNRLRFVIETMNAICSVGGADRVGMRIAPGNPFNELQDDDPEETFGALLEAIDPLKIAYLHVIRMNAGVDNLALARRCFSGAVIANDSYSAAEAAQAIGAGQCEAVSFGRAYIANPDLVARLRHGAALNELDARTLYSPGAKGYTDYPVLRDG